MSLLIKENIIPTLLEEEMSSSYLDYSMSVIVSRALPDVRDGLKPVHRRILYAMYELGLFSNRPYRKSARLVGEVLGKYHPHGDTAVYDAMVRMAQEWSMRYPLVDGQGNYGSIDGDSPAAMRYTETRLAPIAAELLRDIDKDTVDFQPNFDESLNEPVVLPSYIPTLLINGASGIAVGMATNIPPHNLREIVAALKALLYNPELPDEELFKLVPAPDFPTAGIIYGISGVREAYATGRGRIIVRAKAHIDTLKSGKQQIIVTEIPYQVNKSALIEKIADLVRQKVIEEISDLRDESDRDGIRIVIELKRDAIGEIVLNNLYKHTQMQVTFGANLLALVNGIPKVLTLRDLMLHFLRHRNIVLIRKSRFELEASEKRAHILEGLIIALDNIDAVIKTIKEAKDPKEASTKLQDNFKLTETQAKAILEMRLQRLTGLEREKIQNEYKEILKTIEHLKAILASDELQKQIIADDLQYLADKYGDERRTEIIYDDQDFSIEDLIADEDVIVTISHKGFIKRTKVSIYRRQQKGGKGISGASTYEEDFVEHIFQASTHHFIMFFTDFGRVYRIKVYDIPELGRTSKGKSIANLIPLQPGEVITAYLQVRDFNEKYYVMMATKYGTIKKTPLEEFENIRSTGIIAINLNENDKLISARITDGTNEIILGTREGMACRFNENQVRPMGRMAAGVRGITLSENDYVVSMVVINHPEAQVLTVSERGYGKRTKYQEFRLTNRGAKGVISMNITEKTGKVVAMKSVLDTEDLIVITTNGILIRQPIDKIRTIGRNTQGVKLIRLEPEDKIADITTVLHEEQNGNENNDIEKNEQGSQEKLL